MSRVLSNNGRRGAAPVEVARVCLPTPFGEFEARAFQCASGFVYLALVKGDVAGRRSVLTRLHSECLTGDALGSLRCDCGIQLRMALRAISAEGRGVLVYATGHEGRGIGLINKLLAYMEQDGGADTLDANVRLGLPVDAREYGEAAMVLRALGARSIRLLTNNPRKVASLESAGIEIEEVEAIPTAPHVRNLSYLHAKRGRLGHIEPTGQRLAETTGTTTDVTSLLGRVRPREGHPYVVLKYAQTLDGRIATGSGDSRWISGVAERRVSHALRAACDAVVVGVGTVLSDDPQLTVRLVPGASPLRAVLDSTLRIPLRARVLDDSAATIVLTTDAFDRVRRQSLRDDGVAVRTVRSGHGGVDVTSALSALYDMGVRCLLVEGGARVITSMLQAGVVDRLVVGVAPTIIGAGTEAVGELGIARIADGLRLANRSLHLLDDDIIVAWDVENVASQAGFVSPASSSPS